MPDSVEMPAPVKATMLLASPIMRFSSSAFDTRLPRARHVLMRMRPRKSRLPNGTPFVRKMS